jgi:RNA polymerase sigma factor (sigma-70 family)
VSQSDADIVRRSTEGDAKAFGELFWRHNGTVHGYLARRAGRDTADDLVADVWLRAFRDRSNFDTAYADARPWLYGIARNVLNGHWRQLSKAPPLMPVAISDPWPEFEDQIDVGERRAELVTALDALSVDEREALLLVAWERMSAASIALMLNVPASTVRNRLHRARAIMRSGLNSEVDVFDQESES